MAVAPRKPSLPAKPPNCHAARPVTPWARAGRYRQFFRAVKAAEGEAEVRAVAIIQRKMPED